MIKPTVGRVVWFWLEGADPVAIDLFHKAHAAGEWIGIQPQAAIIAYVHGDYCVNLAVFDHDGIPQSRTSVPLWQGEDARPAWMHCEWMPYQKGQAAKTEQLEQQLGAGIGYREPIDNGDRHPGEPPEHTGRSP